jgi:hypothetical protein
MTIQGVARHLCVSRDLVKEIQKQHLMRLFTLLAERHDQAVS